MHFINTFIIWTWLLGISLVVPTSLPAGGSQKLIIQHRENNIHSTLIALKDFELLSSATLNSSIVSRFDSGTPVDVLKVWNSNDSGKWLLVNVLSQNFNQFFYKRGWVNIGTS